MILEKLVPDCAHCAALCCVAFAFDRSADFGHDKAGDEPCRHLGAGFSCTIHDRLATSGYGGCVRFDCHGAGQRVVRELFGGADWKTDPDLKAPMMAAFRVMRRVHEMLHLLETAASLGLDERAGAGREALVAMLDPQAGWTADSLAAFDIAGAEERVALHLRALSGHVAAN
ncbi:MAG: hypothetical protein KKH72_13370 [Alphaproteobacteria bacterium]|nr:hypothetical protein [Alphaproteobacteria bacterium]